MTEITTMSTVGAELRIITAGHTGFENDLRRDESIELIRARTALDAIGELANPIDELSPAETVILVGPDALTPGEAEEFIAAVRSIAPDVKIVLISDSTTDGARFDTVIEPGAAKGRLWSAIGIPACETALTATPSTEPPAPSEPIEVHTRPIRPAATVKKYDESDPHRVQTTRLKPAFDSTSMLDEALLTVIDDNAEDGDPDSKNLAIEEATLETALTGGDTLRAGLAELRTRLGTETVRFTPGETIEEGEPVQRGERIFGALRADGVDRAALVRSARWLASRLAIDEHLRALREAAFTDELTGAWNRRFFKRFLEQRIERARTRRQDLSLMFFDIDDFKTYNDRYGHAAGDEILVEVVRLLAIVIRPHDRVCRIGGDEFAVIFADGPREASSRHPASIETITRRFQRQICEHRFPKLGVDAMGTLTISGGLATFPWEAYDSESLIELADQLTLQSKRAGKNVISMGPGADSVSEAMETEDRPGG